MDWIGPLRVATRPFVRRPVRTLLLLQGTIWGVAVALFPSAVIEGTRQAAIEQGVRLGADRIAIAGDPTAPEAALLERTDLTGVLEALGESGIPVEAAGAARVVRVLGARGEGGAFVEADPATPRARGLVLAEGRWLGPGDDPAACVAESGVGVHVGDRLPFDDPAAEGGRVYHVVGVTRPQTPERLRSNDLGFDVEHPLYAQLARGLLYAVGVPQIEDAWKRSDRVVWTLPRTPEADWIFLRVAPADVKEAARVATDALVSGGRSPVTLHPLVLPFLLGDEIDRYDAVRAALFLACLALGAVVMANLGFLSVLRRRHEIAVHRVEGATRRQIAGRFLLEGLTLTAAGCVVGSGLGMLLAALRVALSPVTGFAWVFPWRDGLVAVGVALFIGSASAVLPALRASRQEPVAGLAEE